MYWYPVFKLTTKEPVRELDFFVPSSLSRLLGFLTYFSTGERSKKKGERGREKKIKKRLRTSYCKHSKLHPTSLAHPPSSPTSPRKKTFFFFFDFLHRKTNSRRSHQADSAGEQTPTPPPPPSPSHHRRVQRIDKSNSDSTV